jgi:hypothetical protein
VDSYYIRVVIRCFYVFLGSLYHVVIQEPADTSRSLSLFDTAPPRHTFASFFEVPYPLMYYRYCIIVFFLNENISTMPIYFKENSYKKIPTVQVYKQIVWAYLGYT